MGRCVCILPEQMEEGGILSLLDGMMEKCCLMILSRADDLYGSDTHGWTEGASFDATIIKDSTTEAVIAEKQGIKEIFTVVIRKGFHLGYHDVFKRISDGTVFRVTSDAKDSEAPEASSVKIAKVTAERYELDD